MTINEALDYIHAVDWRRSSLGLRRIDELLAQGKQKYAFEIMELAKEISEK